MTHRARRIQFLQIRLLVSKTGAELRNQSTSEAAAMTSTQTLSRTSIELLSLPAGPAQNITILNGNTFPRDRSDADDLIQSSSSSRDVNELSKRRATVVVATVAGVNFLNTMGSGILTVALPTIAKDLGLGVELLLW